MAKAQHGAEPRDTKSRTVPFHVKTPRNLTSGSPAISGPVSVRGWEPAQTQESLGMIGDHFEPLARGSDVATAAARVAQWRHL